MAWKPEENASVQRLYAALLKLETPEECNAFLEDLLTRQELITISNRLEAARLLASGRKHHEVKDMLDLSSATVTRINSCLQFGSGGYEMILQRLESSES